MKLIIATVAAVSLAGCALRPADYADAASTAVAIADGASEANPIVGVFGDDLAAPTSLLLTAGARYAIDTQAAPENRETYHRNLSTVKLAATCNNIGVFLGAEPVVLVLSAVTCGALYHYYSTLEGTTE